MQLWLYLDFPSLQLDTLFSEEESQPIVIVDGKSFVITQANQQALEEGIQIGMGMGSASALCGHLQVHPYQADVEENRLKELAQWLYLITSDIILFPPQGILLNVSNMLALYQGIDSYWQALKAHLKKWPVHYQYSCGFSPYSAMLMAKADAQLITNKKYEMESQLNAFSLNATELDKKHIDAFSRIGVTTLNELFELPMAELARRFDIDVVNYVGRLQGQFKHPLTLYRPPEQFITELELLYDIDNINWLSKPLLKLFSRLEQFLLLRNQIAYELECTLTQRAYFRDAPSKHQLTFTSAAGEYRADKWSKLASLCLESVTLESPVHHIGLRVVRSGVQNSVPNDLFVGAQGSLQPLELIALLQAKLGRTSVSKVAMSPDPRPESSTQYLDATETIEVSERLPLLRPSLLFPHPELLNEQVNLVHGPERLVTGWWDGKPITRDYYIAQSHQGRWLWVFRDGQKHWYTHGLFG